MDNCRHVTKLIPSTNHSVLNPQKWSCCVCGTTESVWACLSCPNVACGRFIAEHALKHFKETKHPLAIEVNDRYVFCYECQDYVLNDNATGDIKVLRECLHTIVTTHGFSDSSDRHRHLLRSCSTVSPGSWFDDGQLRDEDRSYTALHFRRHCILAKIFKAWKLFADKPTSETMSASETVERSSVDGGSLSSLGCSRPPTQPAVRPVVSGLRPGVTGLRNLGNTCYINSILQVLSHLDDFRRFFLSRVVLDSTHSNTCKPHYIRQSTMECFEHINSGEPGNDRETRGGLSGGGSGVKFASIDTLYKADGLDVTESVCLSDELHALLRVMWSGKWAVVSPHRLLYAVWSIIPFFKGYSQQDAQEFLCEFVDKLQLEIAPRKEAGLCMIDSLKEEDDDGALPLDSAHSQTAVQSGDIVASLFEGTLVSEVKCLACKHCSTHSEPFSDLSLDFPDRYHATCDAGTPPCIESCHINELLEKFTSVEVLESKSYACDNCNKATKPGTKQATKFSDAEKRLLIGRSPRALRLHLKRFMWSGRNNRCKITSHVDFDDDLDLGRYCASSDADCEARYRLSSVVMHHGRGFLSGHYTAYCWNSDAESWVHCNDSKMTLCTPDDVHSAQAYILVYAKLEPRLPADCLEPCNNTSFKHPQSPQEQKSSERTKTKRLKVTTF